MISLEAIPDTSLDAFIGAFHREVRGFDAKTQVAYFELLMTIRERGSLPDDDRYLAAIAGCTKRFWRDKVKPLLAELFVFQGDGGRVFHPDMDRVARRQPLRVVPAELSQKRRQAANSSWDRRRGYVDEDGSDDADGDANRMQNHMQTDAKDPSISTFGAFGSGANLHAFAAAAPVMPAPSLSESSSLDSREKDSTGERESGRASVGEGVQADANGHAKPDAKPHAKLKGSGAVSKTLLADDWQPPGDVTAEIETAGRDPRAIESTFRAHYKARGETRADWDAAYRVWWARQPSFDPVNPQIPLVRPIHGGAAVKPAAPDPADEAAELMAEAAINAAAASSAGAAQFAEVRKRMKAGLPRREFRLWLGAMEFVGIEDDEAKVRIKSAHTRSHVLNNYGDRLTEAWRAVNPAIRRVDLVQVERAP